MNLDRKINLDGHGKYALINQRTDKVEWGAPGSDEEFFVIKLKDVNAAAALYAYAQRCQDAEFAKDVRELAERAANHSHKKQPD